MNQHDFIFSNHRRHRLMRHLAFWLCWILFSASVQLTAFKPGPMALSDLILYQLLRAVTRLPSNILFCYVTVYFLVPLFIAKRKYISFFLSFLLFVFILYWLNYFLLTPIYHIPGQIVGGEYNKLPFSLFIRKFYSFYSNINFTGAIPACCLMLAIKYHKDWNVKQRRGEQLNRENVQAELQLLKAQIHPHFLFNTLNNIYSFALTKDTRAAALVDKLAGMIDYMRTEGENSLVLLEKEIKLLEDYVGLERVRYGDRLDLQIKINGDYKNKLIAPLLMIPFVENSFKHGSSKMRGAQWIKILINVENNELDFRISNSKPSIATTQENKKGIGLSNVQKRLQLIYPGKYSLDIMPTENTYEVRLKLFLEDSSERILAEPSSKIIVYA